NTVLDVRSAPSTRPLPACNSSAGNDGSAGTEAGAVTAVQPRGIVEAAARAGFGEGFAFAAAKQMPHPQQALLAQPRLRRLPGKVVDPAAKLSLGEERAGGP